MKKLRFLLILIFCLFASIACAKEDILEEMALSEHEGVPWGVPSDYDWAVRPVIKSADKPEDFSAMTGWLQFGFSENSPNDFALIKINYLKTYVFAQKIGDNEPSWHLVQDSGQNHLDGSFFKPDFSDDEQKKAPVIYQSDGAVVILLKSGVVAHFWPRNRADLSEFGEIKEVFVVVEAQLVFSESEADIYLNVGFDWWRNLFCGWGGLDVNNTCGVQGRFKKITKKTRRFYAHTLSLNEKDLLQKLSLN